MKMGTKMYTKIIVNAYKCVSRAEKKTKKRIIVYVWQEHCGDNGRHRAPKDVINFAHCKNRPKKKTSFLSFRNVSGSSSQGKNVEEKNGMCASRIHTKILVAYAIIFGSFIFIFYYELSLVRQR